jgi:hypothetical protein
MKKPYTVNRYESDDALETQRGDRTVKWIVAERNDESRRVSLRFLANGVTNEFDMSRDDVQRFCTVLTEVLEDWKA